MICTSCGKEISGVFIGDASTGETYCRDCTLLGLKAVQIFSQGRRVETRPVMDPRIEARHQKYDRPKIWAMCDAGFSDSEIAEEFGTNILTIARIRSERRKDI